MILQMKSKSVKIDPLVYIYSECLIAKNLTNLFTQNLTHIFTHYRWKGGTLRATHTYIHILPFFDPLSAPVNITRGLLPVGHADKIIGQVFGDGQLKLVRRCRLAGALLQVFWPAAFVVRRCEIVAVPPVHTDRHVPVRHVCNSNNVSPIDSLGRCV